MQLNQNQLKVLRDFAFNLTVLAGSAQPHEEIDLERYHISDTQFVHVLTDLHLFVPIRGSDGFMDKLYRDVTGTEPPKDAKQRDRAFRRLQHCLWSIPSWDAYAALVLEYTGAVPGRRNERCDDPVSPELTKSEDIRAQLSAQAMDHLCAITRVNYIVSSITDLNAFTASELETLMEKRVYVCADLDRFSDRELMISLREYPELLGNICAKRVQSFLQSRGGKS